MEVKQFKIWIANLNPRKGTVGELPDELRKYVRSSLSVILDLP
ncbi:MAG: hypothetical protein WBC65_04070 [Ignavibacteria bacterium]